MQYQLANIYCAQLINTILSKYYWSAVFRKIHTTFFTVYLPQSIGRIFTQSEFKIHFSALQRQLPWQHCTPPKIGPELITRKWHLSRYFYKITLNYTYSDLIYCQTTVSHLIYHHKYRLNEFQTFILVTILFKRCWKNAVLMEIAVV